MKNMSIQSVLNWNIFDKMSADEMSVDKMSLDEMSVDKMTIVKISTGKIQSCYNRNDCKQDVGWRNVNSQIVNGQNVKQPFLRI